VQVNDTNGWEPHLWTFLSEVEHISTFLDVGCGAGLVTKFMLDRGVDARCIEASNEAIRNSLVPRTPLSRSLCRSAQRAARTHHPTWLATLGGTQKRRGSQRLQKFGWTPSS
jgi:hypothetical protein